MVIELEVEEELETKGEDGKKEKANKMEKKKTNDVKE